MKLKEMWKMARFRQGTDALTSLDPIHDAAWALKADLKDLPAPGGASPQSAGEDERSLF
jgi:hypothetical protein